MRIRKIGLSDFKNVEVSLEWTPAIVLFGRNNAGKTNVLEALAEAFAEESVTRQDPLFLIEDPVGLWAEIELDGRGEAEHADQELLARLLQFIEVPAVFSNPLGSMLGRAHDTSFAQTALEWDDTTFSIGGDGERLDLDEALAVLRAAAVDLAVERCRRWEEHRSDFETVLDACLASPWLHFGLAYLLQWCGPLPGEVAEEILVAARRLLEHPEDWEGEAVPIVHSVCECLAGEGLFGGLGARTPFLQFRSLLEFRPFDVIRIDASPGRVNELAERIASRLRDHLGPVTAEPDGDWLAGVPEPLLEQAADGGVSVRSAASELAADLSARATAIAPAFVTAAHDVVVEVLSPIYWHRNQGVPVRLALRPRGGAEGRDLRVAGSGIAVWAGLAIEEALRELDAELAAEGDREEAALVQPLPLYLIDEPEQHLHPRARQQAARWIGARLVGEGRHVVLATHATEFLDLRAAQASYLVVTRDGNGETHTVDIGDDVYAQLDRLHREAGLANRAQLLHVLRAVLIVEGEHDLLVVQHFFAEELARNRIHVLPIRGSRNALALLDAELLKELDVPLIIMFDNTSASTIAATKRPGREASAEVRALWELQQRWNPRSRRPTIVPFELPDVFCALPDECVARVLREDEAVIFPGWQSLLADYRAQRAPENFKTFAQHRLGLKRPLDAKLLNAILERCRTRPDGALERAVKSVIDAATTR